MISPSRLLALLVIFPAVGGFSLYIWPSGWPLLAAIDGAIALTALGDLLTLPRSRHLSAKRECGTVASLGEHHEMRLAISNARGRIFAATVRDDTHLAFTTEPAEQDALIGARAITRLVYTLIPRQRGTFTLEAVYLRSTSQLGLWHKYHRLKTVTTLRVYPALAQISRYMLYARLNRLSMLGVRQSRKIGTDNEFERLRDYASGDDFRKIDWRTTARRRKLTVRDFQANHSQRVVFLVDCGRLMVNEAKGLSLLDHALDAVLTLAYVAASKGDQVGLLCFADTVLRWVEPRGGRRQVNRLVHACHDVFPTLTEAHFANAFLHLHQHCRKRTLVVLVSTIIDELDAEVLEQHLKNLVGQHLPLALLLRDRELFTMVQQAPSTAPAKGDETASGEERFSPAQQKRLLFCGAAAADVLDWRHSVLTNLRAGGVLVVDAFPEDLTAPLINRYLEIKARHLL